MTDTVAALQTSILATCLTNAINTVPSYDPCIYCISSHPEVTLQSLRIIISDRDPFLLPAVSIQLYLQSGEEESRKMSDIHTHAHSHAGKNAYTSGVKFG